MYRYDISDDEEEEFGFAFHNPVDNVVRLLLMRRMMAMQSERMFGFEKISFIKGWSSRPSFQGDGAVKPTQSAISTKVAPLFNCPADGFTDLVITPKVGTPIFAHQFVVASWSNSLKQSILAERRKSDLVKETKLASSDVAHVVQIQVDTNDETEIAIESFFRFMYTESVDLSLETVLAHIRLAIHLEVNELLFVCLKFIQRQLSTMLIRPFLVNFIARMAKLGATTSVVEEAMLKVQSGLFFEEAEIVSSFDVDFLCDVLRSSNVVANSEYDIFQKLKPKLAALREAGKRRQVQRLLGLLRLTQMKASELRELSSGEYIEEMRDAFPGKLESALWVRALFGEQSWDAVPISIEMPRLYVKVPVPFFKELGSQRYIEPGCVELRSEIILAFEQRTFNEVRFKIKDGEQTAVHGDERSGTLSSRRVLVYRIRNGEHGVKQLKVECHLEIPAGKFEFVTVNYKLPKVEGNTLFKLVMMVCIHTETETKRKVFTHTNHIVDVGVTYPISSLPIGEDCDVSITHVVCYVCDLEERKVR